MPELLKQFVVRPAEQLAPQQIRRLVLIAHPQILQSSRYEAWLALCEAGQYQEMQDSIQAFLDSEEPLRSFSDITGYLAQVLNYARYRGYDFDFDTFAKSIDMEQLLLEFKIVDNLPAEDGNFFLTYTNLADQLLGEIVLGRETEEQGFDRQALIKTLQLLGLMVRDRSSGLDINLKTHFEKPLLLEPCFFSHRHCNPGPEDRPGDGCECECDGECQTPEICCPRITPYVADLYVVRDRTQAYEVGDMSYIENVIQSEVREREHRHLIKEEISETEESEISTFEERNLKATDKFSLQKEIENTINNELKLSAGVTYNQKWGKVASLSAKAGFGYNQTKKEVQKEIQKSSKEVIDSSISRLQTKVKTVATRKLTRETEETNKHTFEGPDSDISRQFYYVNQVKKGQVYNYGKRQMLDLYLPEPSELYKRLIEKQFGLVAPVEPELIEFDPKTLTPDNYLQIAQQYGISNPPAPPEYTTEVTVTLQGAPGDPSGVNNKSGSHTFSFPVTIPPNYVGNSMNANIIQLNYNQGGGVSISATLGTAGNNVWHQDGGSSSLSSSLPGIEGNHNVIVHAWDVTEFTWILTVHCALKEEFKVAWQQEFYSLIVAINEGLVADYEAALQAYEETLEEFEAFKFEKYNQNPFTLLQDIMEQLKRAAISYISCQFYDNMNGMVNKVSPCGYPQMDLAEAERDGKFIRFFEQAFEWELMNFVFYPAFWARKCTWADKFAEDADNLLFDRFLKAGAARVAVAVRPGFESYVNYFLATGQIWGLTGEPPIAGPAFVPIHQEIKEEKQNFNTDRDGRIDVVNGSTDVTLTDSDYYWFYGSTSDPAGVDTDKVELDIDREIFIECKPYRIVDIQHPNPADPETWTIVLDRPYEGPDATNLFWSTGAVFIGAPWEFEVPTDLVWLRSAAPCLPEYPIDCP